MIGYRGAFSNQWKVLDSAGRTKHSIHVDWNEQDFGIENMLSFDHLEAIAKEAGIEFDPDGPLAELDCTVPWVSDSIEHLPLPGPSEDFERPSQDFQDFQDSNLDSNFLEPVSEPQDLNAEFSNDQEDFNSPSPVAGYYGQCKKQPDQNLHV